MSASANDRFGVAPAPEGLTLVQELLNTFAVTDAEAPDLLDDLATAQPWATGAAAQWAERRGRPAPDVSLTVRDLPRLRSLRDRLRTGLGAPTDHTVAFRTTATVELSLGSPVTAVPTGRGSAWFTSATLLESFLAQRSGAWVRLKACRKESCHVAFYDRTKSNNAVWHDFRYCGNAMNLRASRARRKALSTD